MTFDNLRTKIFLKSLDAVMTAKTRSRRRCREHVVTLLSWCGSRYDRVASLVGIVDSVLPGAERRVSDWLLRTRYLPFPEARVELLDRGSGSTVFAVKLDSHRVVLKVYRRTLGQRGAALQGLAREFSAKHQTVASWYGGGPSVVEPARFIMLHGPLLSQPAVACVQRFIEGEKSDLFEDFTDAELLHLIDQNPHFRAQFVFFTDRTQERSEKQLTLPDLLGNQNLMVVRSGNSTRLTLIDYGILELPALNAGDCERLVDRLERLRSLRDIAASAPKFPTCSGDLFSS